MCQKDKFYMYAELLLDNQGISLTREQGIRPWESKNTSSTFSPLVQRSHTRQGDTQKLPDTLGWQELQSKVQQRMCYSYSSLCSGYKGFFLRPFPCEFKCAERCQTSSSNFVYVTSPQSRGLMSQITYKCITVLEFLPHSLILQASLPKISGKYICASLLISPQLIFVLGYDKPHTEAKVQKNFPVVWMGFLT